MSNEEHEPGPGDLAGLLKCLKETPNTLSALINDISDSELRWRNSDGEFSALENICHLRDIEAEGYATRINRILDETNPFLADIDGGRLAIERSYNDQDPDLALRAFVVARTKNLEKLRGVDTEELKREGTLEGVGLVTLKRLSEMMREHDEGHVGELRVLRRRLKQFRQSELPS